MPWTTRTGFGVYLSVLTHPMGWIGVGPCDRHLIVTGCMSTSQNPEFQIASLSVRCFPHAIASVHRCPTVISIAFSVQESRFVAWDTEKWIFGNGCQSRSQIRDVFGATFGVPRAWRPALYIFQQELSTCTNSIFQEVNHRCDNNHNTCGPGVSLKYDYRMFQYVS